MDMFDAFYHTHVRLVYTMALARGLAPCEAEDLSQETFLRAWHHFQTVASLEMPAQRAWLRRVLTNLANDAWHRSRTFGREVTEEVAEVHEPAENIALRLDVARALASLEEQDREIAMLRYFLQMNSREIGELLQIPESTIRRRLMDCRKQLADRLLPWKPEEGRS